MQMLTWIPVSVTPSLCPFLCSLCILLPPVTPSLQHCPLDSSPAPFTPGSRVQEWMALSPTHQPPPQTQTGGGLPCRCTWISSSLSFPATDTLYHHLSMWSGYTDLTHWTSIYWLGKAWCWEMGWTWSLSFALLPLAWVQSLCGTRHTTTIWATVAELLPLELPRGSKHHQDETTSLSHTPQTLCQCPTLWQRGRLHQKSMVHGMLQEVPKDQLQIVLWEPLFFRDSRECTMLIKSTKSGVQLPVFKSWLPHILALRP